MFVSKQKLSKGDLRRLSSKRLGFPIAQTPDEVKILQKYARLAGPLDSENVIVEIGTRNGGSALVLAGASYVQVITIDILEDPRLSEEDCKRFGYKYITVPLSMHWARYPGGSRITQVTANSQELDWANEHDLPIGLLFIDGDHDYEACRGDWINFYDHVVPGGYVLIHDYEQFPGVTQFVDEDIGLPMLDRGDSIVVFQKPEDEE